MVIRWGLGKFLNQSSSQTAAHTIKLHVIAINMYWILLLLYDYALKSCDYIVTNALWFKEPCILPLRYRLNFNNKIKHFNHKIKEIGRPFCLKALKSSFFFFFLLVSCLHSCGFLMFWWLHWLLLGFEYFFSWLLLRCIASKGWVFSELHSGHYLRWKTPKLSAHSLTLPSMACGLLTLRLREEDFSWNTNGIVLLLCLKSLRVFLLQK